jgi:hypothetical protein
MKIYGVVEVKFHAFLSWTPDADEWWSFSHSRPFTLDKRAHSIHRMGDSVDPRAELDASLCQICFILMFHHEKLPYRSKF